MRVGFCNGCFDLFHEGHRHFLVKAMRDCDYLIVAVNSNESARQLKGEGRPHWDIYNRIRAVAGFLGPWYHAVIPFDGKEGKLLESIRPDVYFRGGDHRRGEATYYGAEVIQIERLPGISTTEILNAKAQGRN